MPFLVPWTIYYKMYILFFYKGADIFEIEQNMLIFGSGCSTSLTKSYLTWACNGTSKKHAQFVGFNAFPIERSQSCSMQHELPT